MANGIPQLRTPDSSLALLREGYGFIASRCRRLGSDAFATRVLAQPVVCMTGAEAAERFYGGERFTRRRGIPRPTLTLLQDFGSVATLDGAAHRHRKELFMSFMTPERLRDLADRTRAEWRAAAGRFSGDVKLDDAAAGILGRAVCAWTGVPLDPAEADERSADLRRMFDGAGALGPRQLAGQRARRRGERWIERVVDDVRTGRLRPPEDAPLHAIAHHRALDGRPLTTEVAAVEVINLLRPTVAIARFVTFAALALHEHPAWRARLREAAGDEDVTRFVQEVRRTAPFFPLISGRVREAFTWLGHDFAPGDWVMLDLYGTNHDPRLWDRPEAFDPDRFAGREIDPFALVPQGAGDHFAGHRCAGEWVTIELMKVAVEALTRDLDYDVPQQDLGVAMWRMPAVPRSRFVLRDVRAARTPELV